jgi:energy-coupling factor transporter ATP-binding protein EcfA2
MSKETPHIPNMPTTPEQVLSEKEIKEKTVHLSPEQIKEQVSELFELSAARAEAGKHSREAWGGLTKKEREELKAKGEEAVSAHLEAARLDPELAEFRETSLEEYDNRIAELSSNPKVLETYKNRFGQLKETLANVLSYEHLRQEQDAVSKAEEKLRKLYESIGKAPGPIERKKLEELGNRKSEIEKSLKAFELDPEMIDMLQRREIRAMQQDLERYSFAETESRTDLIREVLPDLLQGAPVLFQGETGSGKSQLAKYISERYLNKKPAIISISEQIKESQIIGSRGLEAGQTVFNYSEFVKAQKEGRPAILDEVNLMPHEFAGILHDLLQKRVGDVWVHPVTGEEIPIRAPIMATANLKSERYKQRYELDVATLRRFIGGAGAREIHYHDIGKKDKEGNLIAPETLKILSAVLSDRHGEIQWNEKDAPQKVEELKRFVQACRKIQEDFTLSVREGAEESLSRGDRLAFRELVITLKDQIEIMKAWKASGFREPLDSIVLKEFFHKAEISGRAAKDRENMVKVFIANKLFQDTKPEEFKIQGLSSKTVRQWQGKE